MADKVRRLDIFPFIELSPTLNVPTYLLLISLTYCLCIYWVYRRAAVRDDEFHPLTALDLCLAIMIGGLIGARGLHVIYESPEHYLQNPLDIFKLWQGGFVFYGGLAGALTAAAIFLRRKKKSFWTWADFMAPPIALGYALGRVGCFLNGCCFGRETDFFWAVEFTHTGLPAGARHPTQLYATLWELGVLAALLVLEKRRRVSAKSLKPVLKAPGSLFVVWLGLHSVGRLFMEFFRDDFRGAELMGLSLSTFISLGVLVFVIAQLTRNTRQSARKSN